LVCVDPVITAAMCHISICTKRSAFLMGVAGLAWVPLECKQLF
jgi:hypothetical protein